MTGDRALEVNQDATPTRRRVLAGVGGGLVGGVGVAGIVDSGAAARVDAGVGETTARVGSSQDASDPVDQPLIDAHAHLVPEETLDREPLLADDLIAWMDANGVDRAVILALDSPESYPVQAPSWWILDQVESYPERLLPFCTVDPRTLVYEDDFDAVTELVERYVDRGARGFGELKAGLPIDDSRLETLYELCADHGLPILFHTDDKAMEDEVGLPRLEDVLASYPDVDFVAHAHAWWAHVSADVESADRGEYPDGPVEPGGRVPELLAEYDNLYGDISGLSGWNALARDADFAQSFLERHHEQLVFGTDVLATDERIPHFGLFDRFDLSETAWADIRYRNLEGILR